VPFEPTEVYCFSGESRMWPLVAPKVWTKKESIVLDVWVIMPTGVPSSLALIVSVKSGTIGRFI
jgi:anti-sigma-K factor RskA